MSVAAVVPALDVALRAPKDELVRQVAECVNNLYALAYNLRRVISVLGMAKTMKAKKLVGA